MGKKIDEIKSYQCNIEIFWSNGDEHGIDTIFTDGCAGLYTEDEWRDDDIVSQYDDEDQEEILTHLSWMSNIDFFRPEEEEKTKKCRKKC